MKYLVIFLLLLSVIISGGESRAQDNQPVPEVKINNEYTVGIDDILDISVLQPEKFTSTVTVAPDGTISFPYIGNININGMGLTGVQDEIQKQLADGYMKYPVVSVSLRENRSKKFYIYGEVIKPGTYMLQDKTTMLKAITMAGGFTKYGSSSRVKVLRMEKSGSGYKTIKVNISDVMGGNSSKDEILQPQDIVVVSEGIF